MVNSTTITLHDPIAARFQLTSKQAKALMRLKLETLYDLLTYYPTRHAAALPKRAVGELVAGEEALVYGTVISSKVSKAWKKKIPMGEVVIRDDTGTIKAVWFHQAYLAKKAAVGQAVRLQGKIAARKNELYLANPDIEVVEEIPTTESLFTESESGESYLTPIYPETSGLSSLWFQHKVREILKINLHHNLPDPIPQNLLDKYHLPALATALVWIHTPKQAEHATSARKRFAFEEIFFIQLERWRERERYAAEPSSQITTSPQALEQFISRFPFTPTQAQTRAIKNILADLARPHPMTRLLEGDVGSGKTMVAAATAYAAVTAGYEVAYMAPTEILARQHFDSFINYFRHLPNVQVGLITGSECRKFPSKIDPSGHTHISRSQLLKWVATGQIPILIGTHALIQKQVRFKNLAYAIIDEQHRFGVNQRAKLVRKPARPDDSGRSGGDGSPRPHLLSMTATPIPRTLALTIYGDLDLTLLDELPAGRRPIVTQIVGETEREQAYAKIREELKAGRQAYVICPRIDPPERPFGRAGEPDPTKELAMQAKSAKQEQARLQRDIFPSHTIGLVHSKLAPKAKEEVIRAFTAGEIDVLVSTSVVEVGVNVPNATVIMIEGAERFGLAQLHQLRGRVLRSNHQAYCFALTDSATAKSTSRLAALKGAKSGFELAELDLSLRGAGALGGGKQWGLSDIGMEGIKNIKMVEAARAEAQALLAADPELKKHPLLRERLEEKKREIHFE